MITVRLMGTPEDVATLAACLGAMVEVLETSADYPNRGASVRRGMTVSGSGTVIQQVLVCDDRAVSGQ